MEEEKILFDIVKTQCSYNKKKVVLEIKKLIIPSGKLIFIIGPSGIGKSTILETLGMMNNTLLFSEQFQFQGCEVKDVWDRSKSEKLAQLRNEKFSFIFQQNDLMQNFSAHENAITAALFQGKTIKEVEDNRRKIFDKLELRHEDGPISEYSGGMKQRIAFARAILRDFDVLFGDEPTGNLDYASARNMMCIIRDVVSEQNKTSVIVSHDMDLATEYADVIVQIRKENAKNYGVIDEDSVYTKTEQGWMASCSQVFLSNVELSQKLKSELSNDNK